MAELTSFDFYLAIVASLSGNQGREDNKYKFNKLTCNYPHFEPNSVGDSDIMSSIYWSFSCLSFFTLLTSW